MKTASTIRIETDQAVLVFNQDADGRLRQTHLGAKSLEPGFEVEAFPVAGNRWVFEPALTVIHADGNTSCDLRVHSVAQEGDTTRITLRDAYYPLEVALSFQAFADLDIWKVSTEINHSEDGPITVSRIASSALAFGKERHWLTQFHGAFVEEAQMAEELLTVGTKRLDSKLGVRAHEFRPPWFLLSRGAPLNEESGEVFGGSLAWSGSFSFEFEVTPDGVLRALCGLNPYMATFQLEPGEKFATPGMVWGWSDKGAGQLSRNLHRWVRTHAVRDGNSTRPILLNNWEATYFSFDEPKICSLIHGAAELGMELFLLDDGWFGGKYPRDGDFQGLGDWQVDHRKLPNGLGALADAAEAANIRFGIWVEPEMVNPKSELFEAHPDWAIQQPHRELELQRNQLTLDLTRPEVEEFVFQVTHQVLKDEPRISFVKWDCNRYLTQPGSPYLAPQKQGWLWTEYVAALYRVFDRLVAEHPHVQIMMCAGGGGRVDYASLKYAHEFWPSDRTDGVRRIFIQWGYSYFFPASTVAGHVTAEHDRPLKFAFDIAMSTRLGMDYDLAKLSPENLEYARQAIETYKRIRDVVQLGELYRLESPYAGPRAALSYVLDDRATVFAFSIDGAAAAALALRGLDVDSTYQVRQLEGEEFEMKGGALMTDGLQAPALSACGSVVYELKRI